MPPTLHLQTAFIPANPFAPNRLQRRKQVDKRPPRKTECASLRWTCLVREEEGEADVKQALGTSANLNMHKGDVETGVMEISQVTENDDMGGIVELDMTALNTGLGEALNRSWDNLEDFQVGKVIKDENIPEDETKTSNSKDDSTGNKKPEEATDDIENTAEADVSTQEHNTTQDDIPEGLFDDTLIELKKKSKMESDDAILAIKQAKAGVKKTSARKTTSKKAKTKTKSKTTSKKTNKNVFDEIETQDKDDRTLAEILHSEVWHSEPRWFFLQVKPGCEQSCAISIRNMAQSLQRLEVQDVLVPATEILRLTKGGQSVKKEERIFPGYILVLMVMNYQNYNDLRSVPNVQYFMGDPNRDKAPKEPFRPPIPVSDAEMKVVFDKIKKADSAKVEMKTRIRPGDTIEVLYGSFMGNMGLVKEVKPDSDLVVVRLLMIGREAPVEFAMDQIRVVDDVEETNAEEQSASSNHKDKDGKRRSSKPFNRGTEAGMASAADDLAALLGEVPSAGDGFVSAETEAEDDIDWNFFENSDEEKAGGDDEPFSFLEAEGEQMNPKRDTEEHNSTWDFLAEDNKVNEERQSYSFLDADEGQHDSESKGKHPDEGTDFIQNLHNELRED